MAIQSQPSRIPQPFAGSGTKNVIPATNATPSASQAASWASGFPPECSQPISAGGCPVPRNDVNGALNQISQDFAFRQDGGIWEWSALADYDTQRMVRGSDGKLYWSMAQSGPNVAAGAQDPTADDGTYWGTLPAKTAPALDSSSAVATTQWVRTAVGTGSIYVNGTSGDDSNDGVSSSKAVKTITKAIQLARTHIGKRLKIYITSGSYSEDITLYGDEIELVLQGNVTLSGNIDVGSLSSLAVSGSYTLTVSGYIYIITGSSAVFYCPLSVTSSTSFALSVQDGSFVGLSENCTFTANGSGVESVILILNSSSLYCVGKPTVIANGISLHAVSVHRASSVRLSNGIDISGTGCSNGIRISESSAFSSSASVAIASSCVNAQSILVTNSSSFQLSGGASEINGTSANDSTIVFVDAASSFGLSAGATLKIWVNVAGVSGLYGFWVRNGSGASINGTLSFGVRSGMSSRYHLVVSQGSSIIVSAGATLDFGSGTTYAAVTATGTSILDVATSATVSGTISGSRYIADYGGMIYVHGAGATRFPGSSAGSASSASFGYYG